MSIATIRKALLKNVPNISKFGASIDMKSSHAGHDVVQFKGKSYSIPACYVLHTDCGKRIRALYSRVEYSGMHSREERKARKPLLVYCPQCGAMAGKRIRRKLKNQGMPHTFHSPALAIPNSNRFVASYYTFPKGVGYNLDGEVVSIESKWARCLGGDGEEHYDPDD